MYFITLKAVPFHPDEATYLYMSDDFTQILQDPLSMAYQPGQSMDLRTHYRLMDPPITRLYLGFARAITATPSIQNDWDWTLTWQENLTGGNLPSAEAILIGRIALGLFLPFICAFIYRTATSLMGHWPAIFTTGLFAINPLVLLHFRRNMAEAMLLFFTTWFLMLLSDRKKHSIMLPVIFTLAINSKQTAIFLAPAYAIYFFRCISQSPKREWGKFIGSFLILPILLTFLVNPVAWKAPIATIRAAITERNTLLQGNEYFLQEYQPEVLHQNTAERFLTVIYHTAFEPLALDDFSNYRETQQSSFDQYNNNKIHNHDRNLLVGSISVIIVISSVLMQLLQLWKQRKRKPNKNFSWVFIHITFFSVLFGLSILSSIYQRYVVILIPLTSLYTVWFVDSIIKSIKKQPVY